MCPWTGLLSERTRSSITRQNGCLTQAKPSLNVSSQCHFRTMAPPDKSASRKTKMEIGAMGLESRGWAQTELWERRSHKYACLGIVCFKYSGKAQTQGMLEHVWEHPPKGGEHKHTFGIFIGKTCTINKNESISEKHWTCTYATSKLLSGDVNCQTSNSPVLMLSVLLELLNTFRMVFLNHAVYSGWPGMVVVFCTFCI